MQNYRIFIATIILCSANVLHADAFTQAEQAAQQGNWEQAVSLYQQAAEAEPESTLKLTRLAGALLASQQYADSIPYFQQAISKDPSNASAFIGLGISYLHIGRYNASRAAFTEAQTLQPTHQEIAELITWIDRKLASGERGDNTMPHTIQGDKQP